MAISSSGAPTAGAASSSLTTPVATGTSPIQGAPGAPTDLFTQLIAGMIGASSPAQQSAPPLSPDAAALELGAEAFGESTDDRDTEIEVAEDEDGEMLALAAFLTGLPGLAPAPPAPADGSPHRTEGIESALLGKRAELEVARAGLESLVSDFPDNPGDETTTTAPGSVSTGHTTAHHAAQIHTMLASQATQAPDAAPDAMMRAPVGTPAWKDELGAQLTWMAVNGREAASLKLSPEHLGPLEIRISMREGEASVLFGASNPDTRNALEQSLPRLRELFASQGLVLADAGVSRDAPRHAFKPTPQPDGVRNVSDASSEAPVKSVTLGRLGLIDTYV
jgi:flagellar hook-length control protein FliK